MLRLLKTSFLVFSLRSASLGELLVEAIHNVDVSLECGLKVYRRLYVAQVALNAGMHKWLYHFSTL